MIISILNDNRPAGNEFACEHGLSVHIAVGKASILLDTGQSTPFIENAERMGIDLRMLDGVIISHGHYDHAGGLTALAKKLGNETGKLPLYIGKGATKKRYSKSAVMLKENGMPDVDVVREFDMHEVDGTMDIAINAKIKNRITEDAAEGDDWLKIKLFTLPMNAPENPRLVTHGENEELVADTFRDEVFALITQGEKDVLFGGCTHHGLKQLLNYVRETFGINRLTAFVGGLHLSGRTREEIAEAAVHARNIEVGQWIVNHCTGEDAINYWESEFGAPSDMGKAGKKIII